MENEDDQKGYRWETEYEKTWEAIREDEHGLLTSSLEEIVHKSRRKRLLEKKNLKLGMMRHLYVILDCSEAMLEPDLKPTRYLCTLKLLEKFIEEYFDQNPISQLGIICTKNKRAEKLTELAGNPKQHINVLQNSAKLACVGEPSLQNALELAIQTLRFMPTHTSREILVIFGSLTTCDPGDIYETVDSLVSHNIRCSIIGLAAELVVCRKITKATQGSYNVVIDDSHFHELLCDQVSPPPATSSTESSLIRMGFPYHQSKSEGKPSMCMCHLDSKTPHEGFGTEGYYCPQCNSKYCELPVECKACGLTLVSAPHLARSFHHLFPLDCFNEIPLSSLETVKHCYSCLTTFTEQTIYQCGVCNNLFCLECDLFIHDSLHTCPGCSSSRKQSN
ncbi:general transcription factor IIH subunit 2 [Trichonephila inaurata madagascariensis]|uniref:General transcription factor IIH subunit n=1 Tax=Trichonephila inaurata madagascariensis TaxID=2747483 RepID=A0A8X6WRA1_9ARAC|nr:general transcription factor IIH subunit 2 [Trichonephila inaurata madagascariensis]